MNGVKWSWMKWVFRNWEIIDEAGWEFTWIIFVIMSINKDIKSSVNLVSLMYSSRFCFS
jgi:hypothetical protein